MKSWQSLLLAVFLSSGFVARALTPDERYIHIYNIMQEAEGYAVRGEDRAALDKFRDALRLLREFQSSEPAWNPAIVSYRIDYLNARVKKMTERLASVPAPATNAPPAVSGPPNEVIKRLQADVARLNQENATLRAKLKEALSVQPAASDPRELLKAQQQIKDLLKERDLLRVTIEQLRDASRAAPTASTADQQTVAELQKQIAQQSAMATTLREQNEALQRQLSQGRQQAAPGQPDVATRLSVALDEIAALQVSNKLLLAEMESRRGGEDDKTKELEKEIARARNNVRSLEDERDTLSRKLNEAEKELKGKLPPDTAAKLEDLTQQLTVTRARLAAYEARPVPFTPEEQALIKNSSANMAVTSETNVVKRKSLELPRGTAPLFNDAQRAIEAKRFGEAEGKLKQVLSQDEKNVDVLANLAAVQLDQYQDKPEKAEEAEKNLKTALSIDPRDPACLYLMGSLKLRQQKYDEALDALSQAVQLSPDNPMAQYYLGMALIFKANTKAAETAFRKAVTLKSNWGEPHYQLAVIYATGNPSFPELARWHYQKAIAGGMPRNFELERRLEKDSGTKP